MRHTGNPLDKVVGAAVRITEDELDAADEYKVEDYHRERVRLASGAGRLGVRRARDGSASRTRE